MNNPPFAFSINAYTFSGFDGATATPTIPHTAFGKPFLFNFGEENPFEGVSFSKTSSFRGIRSDWQSAYPHETMYVPIQKKFQIAVEHARLFEKEFVGIKPFEIMKKHFKAYLEGFDGAGDLRAKVYECKSADEIEQILDNFLKENPILVV